MATLWAIVDTASGKKYSDPCLRFRASLLLEEFLTANPRMAGRVELRQAGEMEYEDFCAQQKAKAIDMPFAPQGDAPRVISDSEVDDLFNNGGYGAV